MYFIVLWKLRRQSAASGRAGRLCIVLVSLILEEKDNSEPSEIVNRFPSRPPIFFVWIISRESFIFNNTMMNHDEVGRGDFVLLDEISSQSFIHNLRIRLVNFDTCTQTVPVPLVFFFFYKCVSIFTIRLYFLLWLFLLFFNLYSIIKFCMTK